MIEAKPLQRIKEFSYIKWFSLSKLPKCKTIASDYCLLKNKLQDKVEVVQEFIKKGKKTTRLSFEF